MGTVDSLGLETQQSRSEGGLPSEAFQKHKYGKYLIGIRRYNRDPKRYSKILSYKEEYTCKDRIQLIYDLVPNRPRFQIGNRHGVVHFPLVYKGRDRGAPWGRSPQIAYIILHSNKQQIQIGHRVLSHIESPNLYKSLSLTFDHVAYTI